MKVKVVTLDDAGGGYCVITRDDGSTFGQQFANLPIDDPQQFDAAVEQVADDAVRRTTAPAVKQINPAVTAKIGQEWDVVKGQDAVKEQAG